MHTTPGRWRAVLVSGLSVVLALGVVAFVGRRAGRNPGRISTGRARRTGHGRPQADHVLVHGALKVAVDLTRLLRS